MRNNKIVKFILKHAVAISACALVLVFSIGFLVLSAVPTETSIGDNIIVAGNVGIGTTTPGYKLDVSAGTSNVYFHGGDSTTRFFPRLGSDRTISGMTELGNLMFVSNSDASVNLASIDWYADGIGAGRDSKLSINVRDNGTQRELLLDGSVSGGQLTWQGNVGIGTTNPGTYKLNIAGTGYLGAAAWVYSSDIRLKENVSYIQSGLNVIENLKPAQFDFINGDKNQIGFIAQDVQEVLPNIVTEGPDGMLGMKTDSIIPYLVKAIQEQQKEIEELKAKLNIGQ